jgi:hypothetical protein
VDSKAVRVEVGQVWNFGDIGDWRVVTVDHVCLFARVEKVGGEQQTCELPLHAKDGHWRNWTTARLASGPTDAAVEPGKTRVEVGQVWEFIPGATTWRITRIEAHRASIESVHDSANCSAVNLKADGTWHASHQWKLVSGPTGFAVDEVSCREWAEAAARQPIQVMIHQRVTDAEGRASKLADVCAMLDDEVSLLRGRLERAAVYFGPTAWKKFMAREETKR